MIFFRLTINQGLILIKVEALYIETNLLRWNQSIEASSGCTELTMIIGKSVGNLWCIIPISQMSKATIWIVKKSFLFLLNVDHGMPNFLKFLMQILFEQHIR